MTGRIADGGLGQETVDARGRRKIRMDGSNRLRNPGGAIQLFRGGPGVIAQKTRKPDVWKRSTARSGPRQGPPSPYEGLNTKQKNSLNRLARAAGLGGRTPAQMAQGALEMRARLDAGQAQGRGALRNYVPRTQVQLSPGQR